MNDHADDALNEAMDEFEEYSVAESNRTLDDLITENGQEERINNFLTEGKEAADQIFGSGGLCEYDYFDHGAILDKCELNLIRTGETKSNFDKMYDRYQKMSLHVKKPPTCKMPSNCTICGKPMKEVQGKFGAFAGCSNWPHCKQVGHTIIK